MQIMRDMRVFLMLVNFLKVKKARGMVMRSRAPIAMARYLSGSTESQIMTPQIAMAEKMKMPSESVDNMLMSLLVFCFEDSLKNGFPYGAN